ncbi:MAG: hypothetical protein ABS948_12010 [Solibacillus sp.]
MSDVTVKEIFDYAIEREHVFLAHWAFLALQQKLVTNDDKAERLKQVPLDMDVVKEFAERNVLGMRVIKLYVVRDANDYYAFYFANNSLEASMLHTQKFGKPRSIVEAPSLMHRYMHIAAIEDHAFLIDYRKRFVEFPVYIGHAKANEHYLQRLDGQVRQIG